MGYIGAGVTRFNTADELTVTGDAQIDTTTLVVDSTNNRVGIGTSGPSALLHLDGTTPSIYLQPSADTEVAAIRFRNAADSNTQGMIEYNHSENSMSFRTNGVSDRLFITSAGLVGIGTASPGSYHTGTRMTVYNSGDSGITVASGTGNAGRLHFADGTTGDERYRGYIVYDHANDSMQFATSGSEAARIDSSGNLLVGKTSEDATTVGSTMRPNGGIVSVRDGDTNLVLNRKTSDGTIVDLRKDGTTVGSIGTKSGSLLIGSTDTYLRINDPSDTIFPSDSAGLERDNTIDLGKGSSRFKDLYLSGGITLGDSHFIGDSGADNLLLQSSSGENIGYDSANGAHIFYKNGIEKFRVDDTGNVGIGTSSPSDLLHVESSSADSSILVKSTSSGGDARLGLTADSSGVSQIRFGDESSANVGILTYAHSDNSMQFRVGGSERMRIDSSGNMLVGKTATGNTTGTEIRSNGRIQLQTPGDDMLRVNRTSDDGALILLKQDGTTEGTISVSGTTVTYGGGHLARWSRLSDNSKDTSIVKGTVMTNLDQMVEWGDEDNEQLNCTAVSSTEGDANVAGVFVSWDESDEWNDYYVAMTGDMVIRIAQGTTVARGDLLMSAGDGTAKPQGDDIVRSKTIAKVTSTNVSHTYDDGTYLVPCVLMAC